jgi:hypothetical protein
MDFSKLSEEDKLNINKALESYDYELLKNYYIKIGSIRLGSCCYEDFVYNAFKLSKEYGYL